MLKNPVNGICSCCLTVGCLENLWDEHTILGAKEVYGDMIIECFSIEPHRGTPVHSLICNPCVVRLRQACEFKRQIADAQSKICSLVEVPSDADNQDTEIAKITLEIMKCEPDEHFLDFADGDVLDEGKEMAVKFEESSVENTPKSHPTPSQTESENTIKNEQTRIKPTIELKLPPRNAKSIHIQFIEPSFKPTRKTRKHRTIIFEDKVNNKRSKVVIVNDATMRSVESANKRIIKPTITIPRPSKSLRDIPVRPSQSSERYNVQLLLDNSNILPFNFYKGTFYCIYCNLNCAEFCELEAHCNKEHSGCSLMQKRREKYMIKANISNLKCKACSLNIEKIEDLTDHLKSKHDVKFEHDSMPNTLKSLMCFDLSDNKNRCVVCKEDFMTFMTLSSHMNVHGSDLVCEICGRNFIEQARLDCHLRRHDDSGEHQCSYCLRNFFSESNLNYHVKYYHAGFKSKYMCNVCFQKFPTANERDEHFNLEHSKKKQQVHQCPYCPRTFPWRASMRAHRDKVHLKKIIKLPRKYQCDSCGSAFTTKTILKNHMASHMEKSFECSFCKKRYPRKYSLVEHLKIHTNERRWSCAECGQSFIQKCSLKYHIKTHTKDVNEIDKYIVDNKIKS